MLQKILSVKDFLSQLEQELTCPKEELQNIIRAKADYISPKERLDFINEIKSFKKHIKPSLVKNNDLMDDIDEFIENLKDKMEEEPDFYNHYDDYGDDESSYFEDDVPELISSFNLVENTFNEKKFSLARKAYEKLFTVFDFENDYGDGIRADQIEASEFKEIYCRYLRSIYETESVNNRPVILFDNIKNGLSIHHGISLFFSDIMNITSDEIPDKNIFLESWIDFLNKSSDEEADPLLREAIFLLNGIDGIADLAKRQWKVHPRAYLDWLKFLKEEKKHKEIITISLQALNDFPSAWAIRAEVADYLCLGAEFSQNKELFKKGRWEAFKAKPTLSRILDLYSANRGEINKSFLIELETFLNDWIKSENKDNFISYSKDSLEEKPEKIKSLLSIIYLMDQNWPELISLAQNNKSLGWGDIENSQGFIIPSLFFLLAGGKIYPNISKLWNTTLKNQCDSYFFEEYATEKDKKRLEELYNDFLPNVNFYGKEKVLIELCLKISKKRIFEIVSNKHRNSYYKAANLTMACVELLNHFKISDQSILFYEEILRTFNHYPAFKKELLDAQKL